MRSTRILSKILLLLIVIIIGYYVINYRDTIIDYGVKIYRKYYNPRKVVVPTESVNHRRYLYTSVSETDNFEPNSIEDIKKIYYTVLNNGWDSFTFYCSDEYTNCIEDVKTIADSNKDTYIDFINNYVSPYNMYRKYNTQIINDDTITLTVQKLYTEEDRTKVNNIVESFIKKNNINVTNPTKKDLEKIHDYIIKKATYDKEFEKGGEITDSSKATGALINGVALCSGYTDAFSIFLDRLNIPNFKITSEEHAWNVVYFNKKWSHVDVTWDDDEINKDNNRNFYFISSSELYKKDKKDHNFNKELFKEIK